MEKSVNRKSAVAARNKLEHAIFHFKQATHSAELDAGLTAALSAFGHIRDATLDVCYASTGAELDADSPGNVRIGITAHCACGRVFTDDVHACAPGVPRPACSDDVVDRVVRRLHADVQFYDNTGAYNNTHALDGIREALKREFETR